jgi:hypothetical protein
MVGALCGRLNAQLPKRFVASVESYVWVHEPEGRRQQYSREPDVHVSERTRSEGSSGGVAVLSTEPMTIVLPTVEPERHRYVQIVDREGRTIITAIELLSPANKSAGTGRKAYLRKRDEYRAAGVSLVEIDLLRRGKRLPLGNPPPEVRDFYVMICPYWEDPRASFWAFTVRDPFPPLPIPLADDVDPVALELRPCLDRVYDDAQYDLELYYNQPLAPRLSKPDAAWVNERLAARRTNETTSPEKE